MTPEAEAAIREQVDLVAGAVSDLIDLIDGGDMVNDAALVAAHDEIVENAGYLWSKLYQALQGYDWLSDEAETPYGVLTRDWQSGSVKWDWELTVDAWVEHAAREHGLDADQVRELAGDMAACIGPAQSKNWKSSELKRRGIFSEMMRRGDGGRWRYRLLPIKDEAGDDGD